MADIIHLLPDSVANQIAAGEVIQRPASVVKELIENSVDAGADKVIIQLKDAGRTLIQVIDNGIGMSDTDARLSFERHATSKIKNAGDLFEIRTKGFRGEALASIAAIAQVTMKTRQSQEEIGTEISINGSELAYQISGSCATGTNFCIKNLFFNVPARRKFLKSNSTELKHIFTEFQRVVVAHPEVEFNLIHNDVDIYRLPKTNLRQRIIHVFGKSINTNLNSINTETSLVKISGFIGKPELARKTTGEQFFFINNRYMRHPYFHRALMRAYEKILPPETYPAYFIFMDADPQTIDVNIHPTKTEIKFENEQAIFQIIQAAVKEALGKSSVVPSIDFSNEGVVDIPVLRSNSEIKIPEIQINRSFNPFEEKSSLRNKAEFQKDQTNTEGWEQLYTNPEKPSNEEENLPKDLFDEEEQTGSFVEAEYLQFKNRFIITSVKSGLMIVDQKRAHERILYEHFIHSVANNQNIAQRELYPTKIDLDPSHYLIIHDIKDELYSMGLDISDLGSNTIAVNSCPAGFDCHDIKELIEQLIEEYKVTDSKPGASITKMVAASLAKAASIDYGKSMRVEEMQQLIDGLFACENPNYAPNGKKIITIMQSYEIEKLIG